MHANSLTHSLFSLITTGSSRGEEEDEMLLEKWEKYLTELLDLDWIEVGSSHDFLMGAGETTETEMKCKICPTVRVSQSLPLFRFSFSFSLPALHFFLLAIS